ncbi:HAAS signaling domain-containing protein [Plantactinospora sp. CA-290183]|uniref:HAAS signaling domain-containing protein n=1 Tax=Plantactinospora sp. CA-290183 TaxID=3240006 RepID=UPI003D922931
MTVVTEQEIASYVGRVRAALADLPPAVRDELLEELPEHLAEVAVEGEGSLTERLGPPEAYAVELRAAAGVAAPAGGANLDQRISAVVGKGRERLRAVDTRLGPVLGYARLSEFLRLLRPAWWLLRGYLVAMLVTVMVTGEPFGLLPRLGGSTLAALLLLAATVAGSVWLGRRSATLGRRPTWVLHLSSAFLVIFGLVGFFDADSRAAQDGYGYHEVYTDQYSGVRDVYVYDSEGRLVEGVRLFDQNGEPIRLGGPWCDEARERLEPGESYVDPMQQPYPYCPQHAPFQLRGPGPSATPAAVPTSGPDPAGTPIGDPSASPSAVPTSEAPAVTPTPTS